MRITVAILIAALQASWAYPYAAPLYSYGAPRTNLLNSGLAQGYIRYTDADGAERLVGYSYPEPLYTVHRLSFDTQKSGSTPQLKTTVQPGYIEQEYIYNKDTSDNQAMREQHFRAWNLQRYQALKSEVDKLYSQGQTPSADMLARLQQLQDMSATTKTAILSESPEAQKAHAEHLRLWNEARLRVLNLEHEQLKQSAIAEKQSEVAEAAKLQNARDEHLRLYNEQLLRISKLQNEAAPISFPITDNAALDFPQSQTQFIEGSPIIETPEVLRAKQEHLRFWHEAKQRADAQFKHNAESLPVPRSNLVAPQANQLFTIVTQQPEQVDETKALTADTSQAQQDFVIATADRIQEQAELAEEEMRQKELIRKEEEMRELHRMREAERLLNEKRQMEAERKRQRSEDEAQLKHDLNEQHESERAAKVSSEIVPAAGVYILNNRYEHNPFLFRFNTRGGHSTYYSTPGGRAAFVINPTAVPIQSVHIIDNNQAAVKVPDLKSIPTANVDLNKAADNNAQAHTQALAVLDKANQDHFRAHDAALKQLNLADHEHYRAHDAAVNQGNLAN